MFQGIIIVVFIIVLFVSFGITYLYKIWATKHSILDIPNKRSSHSTAIPRGGGIAVVISYFAGVYFLYSVGEIDKNLLYALIPGLFLAIVGATDDILSLTPMIRFTVHFICAGIALYFLGGFKGYFYSNLEWFWYLISLIGFVWFINLFNFLDGSDGYASMEAISISIALWFFTGMNFILLLAFAVGGFLYWNWPKAKIFMGDAGSTTIGYLLVVFGIYLHNKEQLNFLIWIIATALFWFDATITLFRRILYKEKLSQAHKKHIYQRAIQGGFSHKKTMFIGLGINILLFLICFTIWKKNLPFMLGFFLILMFLWLAMKYVDKKCEFNKQE